jgi:long-chain acyl-CoA synthetase
VLFAWHDFAEAAQAGAEEAGAECILVAPGEFEELLGAADPPTDVAARADDDTAVILYTSGTTGSRRAPSSRTTTCARNVEVGPGLFELGADDVILGACRCSTPSARPAR